MSIIDDYKQLRMIENIKNFKEMEMAYKANLKLCKYQEQQINKLATCIAEIKEIAEKNKRYTYVFPSYFVAGDSVEFSFEFTKNILQKISEVEDGNN